MVTRDSLKGGTAMAIRRDLRLTSLHGWGAGYRWGMRCFSGPDPA